MGVIEIYNEELNDLIDRTNPVNLREKNGQVYPAGLKEVTVEDSQRLIAIAEKAQRQRKTAETAMNTGSSRSHTVLRVMIEMSTLPQSSDVDDFVSLENAPVTTSVLHFVDLAGSEKQSQTGADGIRLVEASNINKSLSTLSLVINQLSSIYSDLNDGGVQKNASTDPRKPIVRRFPFVSFRDSKLTRLLSSTLSGEAFITLICNVTIANEAETKSTLQ